MTTSDYGHALEYERSRLLSVDLCERLHHVRVEVAPVPFELRSKRGLVCPSLYLLAKQYKVLGVRM